MEEGSRGSSSSRREREQGELRACAVWKEGGQNQGTAARAATVGSRQKHWDTLRSKSSNGKYRSLRGGKEKTKSRYGDHREVKN